uniref:Uncharacterized protein n=1 Tax=Leersia perrieri TaxID=77586 RepID=A0A0D9VV75_9ORYZ
MAASGSSTTTPGSQDLGHGGAVPSVTPGDVAPLASHDGVCSPSTSSSSAVPPTATLGTTVVTSSSTLGVVPAAQRSSNASIVVVPPTVNQHAMQTRKGNTSLILTCEHVLKDHGVNSIMNVTLSTGQKVDARVAYLDKDKDLALLRVDGGLPVSCNPFEFWENGTIVTGIDVVLLAFFPMSGGVATQPGTFPGKISSEPVRVRGNEEIRCDYISMPGTSGSPIILQRLNMVVGVDNGAENAMKICTSFQTIKEALNQWLQNEDDTMSNEDMLSMIAQ